jgi:hypothetical protein
MRALCFRATRGWSQRRGCSRAVRPRIWRPPVEPTPKERSVIERIKRAKLFVFLRKHRHEIFDEEFQEELGTTIYRQSALGQSPPYHRRNSRWSPSCRRVRASLTTKPSKPWCDGSALAAGARPPGCRRAALLQRDLGRNQNYGCQDSCRVGILAYRGTCV